MRAVYPVFGQHVKCFAQMCELLRLHLYTPMKNGKLLALNALRPITGNDTWRDRMLAATGEDLAALMKGENVTSDESFGQNDEEGINEGGDNKEDENEEDEVDDVVFDYPGLK